MHGCSTPPAALLLRRTMTDPRRRRGLKARAVGIGRDARVVGIGRDARAVGIGRDARAVGIGRDARAVGIGRDARVHQRMTAHEGRAR